MENSTAQWEPASMHCPNCGGIVRGYKKEDGSVKLQCRKCGVMMVAKRMGRRHNRLDLFVSDGRERLDEKAR